MGKIAGSVPVRQRTGKTLADVRSQRAPHSGVYHLERILQRPVRYGYSKSYHSDTLRIARAERKVIEARSSSDITERIVATEATKPLPRRVTQEIAKLPEPEQGAAYVEGKKTVTEQAYVRHSRTREEIVAAQQKAIRDRAAEAARSYAATHDIVTRDHGDPAPQQTPTPRAPRPAAPTAPMLDVEPVEIEFRGMKDEGKPLRDRQQSTRRGMSTRNETP